MPRTEPTAIDRRLRDVVAASGRLVDAVEPPQVIAALLDSVIRLFDLEACSIGLLDGERLRFSFSRGRARVNEFEVDAGVGIAGWVAKTGRGLLTNDVRNEPRFYGGVDQKSGFRTRAILCAPLRRDDRVLGVIEAINPAAAGGFVPADLRLLSAFADVAAGALERARAVISLRQSHAELRAEASGRYRLVPGTSPAMKAALRLAKRAASSAATVLLLGESGTGKEVAARAIHEWSPRRERPFVAVNCTALGAELLESELFGHERGAFTGAVATKPGKLELADGGTIFLDEIGDLAPALQAKLLRAIQEREFQRVGGTRDIRVDVRILAATNRDLPAAVESGQFREDLFYRLNVITIELPPLRERIEDLPELVDHFVERFCREVSRPPLEVSSEALACLRAHPWRGNVRELQNAIERAVVLAAGPALEVDDLPADVRGGGRARPRRGGNGAETVADDLSLRAAIDAFTRARIERVLSAVGGSQTEAARRLGLPQSNLSRLMKRLGLR